MMVAMYGHANAGLPTSFRKEGCKREYHIRGTEI